MSNVDKEVQKKIPISISVKMLDELCPWLKNIRWNEKDDEESLLKEKKDEKCK